MNITVNDLLQFVTDNSITCKLGPNSVVIPGSELTKFAVADLPVPSGLRLSRLDISIDEQVNYKLALATNPDTPEPVQAICIQKDRPADDKAIRAKLDSLLQQQVDITYKPPSGGFMGMCDSKQALFIYK